MDWLSSLRKFQIAEAKLPITMTPPIGEAPFKTFKLSSGLTYSPDFHRGGRVVVNNEADAIELEREGWSRHSTKETQQ